MMKDWILTRTDTGDTVILPQDMRWVDEFDWSKVAQSEPVYSLSGSLLIQRGIKKAGRPITLSGEWVWHYRSVITKLQTWADIPDLPMTLAHYDGRVFNVSFRLHDKAIDAEPVHYSTPEQDSEIYQVTVQLMTV